MVVRLTRPVSSCIAESSCWAGCLSYAAAPSWQAGVLLAARSRCPQAISVWLQSLAVCISLMGFTSISLRRAGMQREPGTISPARSCHSRERAAGDYVHAGRLAGAVLYGAARCPEYDRWQ